MSIRTQRSARIKAAGIVAVLIASLFAFVAPSGALAPTDPVVRYAGVDRYDTAARAAIGNFTANANANIVLASGENFPDGLAAAYLAGAVNGPLLLTARASLPASTANALGTLAAANTTVHVVGGTAAVSDNVRSQLTALGYTVNEIGGATRYETAAAVSAAANTIAGVGNFQGQRTAIVATGENFADALSAGPLAYADRHPILLTTPGALSTATDTALTSLNIERVIILGGTAAVSQNVQDAIAAKGITVQRVSGANRYATAAALGGALVTTAVEGGAGWPTPFKATLALGTNFADALSASQVGGRNRAPIVLTASVPEASANFLRANASLINGLYVMGGTAAISADTLTAAREAATPVQLGATITALHGRSSFTVAFDEPVTAPVAGSFAFTSEGRVITVNTVTATTGAPAGTSWTVTINAADVPPGALDAFKPGDVVTLQANQVFSIATGQGNGAVSATVAADTTAPTALIVRASDNYDEVWVAFSEPVRLNPTPPAGVTAGRVDVGPQSGTLTAVDPATFQNVLWNVTLGADADSGQAISIAAGAFTDLAGNPNAAISGVVITDTTNPTLASATYTMAPGASAFRTLTGGGTGGSVTITAKPTGAAAGVAGNAWSVVSGNAAAPFGVSVNTNLRQIGINGSLTGVDANVLAAALNGNATFTSLFTATVNTGGTMNVPVGALSGGDSTVTVRAQFSESLDPASALVAGNIIRQGGGSPAAIIPANAGAPLGVLVAIYTANQPNEIPASISLSGGEAIDLAGRTNVGANVPVTAG